jgi:hypothetical protein
MVAAPLARVYTETGSGKSFLAVVQTEVNQVAFYRDTLG